MKASGRRPWQGRRMVAVLAALLALGGLAPAGARADTLMTFTVAASTGVTYGGSVTLTATADPADASGDVSFTWDGQPAGTAALSAGVASVVVSLPSAGDHSFAASYAGDGTYDPASDGPHPVSVAKAAITATAGGTKVYGDPDPALAPQVTSGTLVGSDSFSGAVARDPGETVGSSPYAVRQGSLALSTNYDLTFVDGSFSITRAPLTVKADDKTKAAGSVFTAFTGSITGLRSGDTVSATYASAGSPPSAPAGSYPIVATLVDPGGSLANYTVTNVTGTLTVLATATAVELASSLNPAPPGQSVTIRASVTGIPRAQGTLQLQSSPDGFAWTNVGGLVAVIASGAWIGATFQVALPVTAGSVRYRAAYTSSDPNLGGSISPELVQVIEKAPALVAITSLPAAWEATVPVVLRATVRAAAKSVTAIPGGSVTFSIDGGPAQAIALVGGVADLPATTLAEGPHTVTVTYGGDATFLPGATSSITQVVAANVVNASGVGVSDTAIYPVRDSWRDTITVRGTREEPLAVSIRIYRPDGRLLLARSLPVAAGSYAFTWDGRSGGVILPAGKYRIVQALTDVSTRPALTRTWTSVVGLSRKRMTWRIAILEVAPGARNYRFSSGQGVGAASASSKEPLLLAGDVGGWPAVGYELTLPKASAYREVRFQVRGSASGATPTLGLQLWSGGADWGQVYRPDFGRTVVVPAASTWRGVTVKAPGPYVSGARKVRGYVDGGGRLAGAFRLSLSGVRVVVVYGTLE